MRGDTVAGGCCAGTDGCSELSVGDVTECHWVIVP